LVSGRSLKFASCRSGCDKRSYLRSATAIHSATGVRTPNLRGEQLYYWAIAVPLLLFSRLNF